MNDKIRLSDMSRQERKPLAHLENEDLMPLPPPFSDPAQDHNWTPLSAQVKEKYESALDDTCAVSVPQPKTKQEQDALVARFLSGLEKLFTKENNWTFLQPLLRDIVMKGRIKLDPSRNDFPVTLHDPCNMVRLMGVVEPQREIVRKICPRFREMEPHGVDNYCCGGGSGFAIMSGNNFPDWRFHVSGRKKLEQILNAFADCLDPSIPKYLCAPCSNCKGQFRDMLTYYNLWEKQKLLYCGLVELIVNAMTDVKPGFIEWEWH